MSLYSNIVLGFPGEPELPEQPPEGTLKKEGVLLCPGAKKCRVTLALAAAWVQLGIMTAGKGSGLGSVEWQAPQLLFPITMTMGTEGFDAVRVYKFAAADKPQIAVSVE